MTRSAGFKYVLGASAIAAALAIGSAPMAVADELPPDQAIAVADNASTTAADSAGAPVEGLTLSLPAPGSLEAAAVAPDGTAVTLAPVTSDSSDVVTIGDQAVTDLDAASTSVVTEPVSDGLRSTVVINGADAPTRFDFELGLPEGVSARAESNGSVSLVRVGEEGLTAAVGSIDAPWAKDDVGASVPTHFELNGGILTQVVEHSGYAYPVAADPKITYGAGVYLNLWGYEANAIRIAGGGALSALIVYGCNFAKLPTGYTGAGVVNAAIKLACVAGGSASAIAFLQSLIKGEGLYDGNQCYQTRLVPPGSGFTPVGPENCS